MKTCLIVDDSPFDRKLLKHSLDRFGIYCEQAVNPQELFDECARTMPDVILLDWELPDTDGSEMLRNIRLMPNGRDIVVIVCTGSNQSDFKWDATVEGITEFIAKPVTAAQLELKLQQAGLIP